VTQQFPAVASDGRSPSVPSARPIHRAIDCATAATLELQRLHRSLAAGEPLTADRIAALAGIEAHLRALGDLLLAIRDDDPR
jgi:hypothetical protein